MAERNEDSYVDAEGHPAPPARAVRMERVVKDDGGRVIRREYFTVQEPREGKVV